MAFTAVQEALNRPTGFRYEPIGAKGGCGLTRRRRPRHVLVACTLVCALLAVVACAMIRDKRLTTAPPEEDTVANLGNPASLASSVGAARPKATGRHQYPSPSLATVERGALQVRVSNHYQLGENATTDLSLYPWEHVAEPYRETRIELARVPHAVEDGANIM